MERYEIGCAECGVLEYVETKREAFLRATLLDLRHGPAASIMVYDHLAHRGKPELWTSGRTVVEVRA